MVTLRQQVAGGGGAGDVVLIVVHYSSADRTKTNKHSEEEALENDPTNWRII